MFDPDAASPPPIDPPPAAPQVLPEWEERAIGDLLGVKGRLLHAAVGVAEEDWKYTELDLAAIAPPLTRILNRYEPIRQYAGYADPISVAIGVAGYATRSAIERRQALDVEALETEQEIPPADAPPVPPTAAPPPPPPARRASPAPTPPVPPAPPAPGVPINADEISWERSS